MVSIRELMQEVSVDNWPSLLSAVDQADKWADELPLTSSIHFLRNYTIEGIEPFLKYHLYSAGIRPEISFGDYGTFQQELLDEGSRINRGDVDVAVLSLVLEEFSPGYGGVNWQVDKATDRLNAALEALAANKGVTAAVNTFIPPFLSETGIAYSEGNIGRQVAQLNQTVWEYASQSGSTTLVVDWGRIVRQLGERESINRRYWYLYKAPFTKLFLHSYARELAKIVKALKGKAKKCLVLDCDNTLWGGIVGEDGPTGIKLDNYEYPGKVFYDLQQSVLHLAARGVLIALCSKNNEGDVWEVLDGHPHCLIKRDHLSAWKINWENKAENIRAIADELNIGIDSVVFVDDSPVECDMVRGMLPDVTVLQVPAKLYNYPDLLLQEGLFDTLAISSEDRQRTQYYQSETKRKVESQKFANVEEYLSSLAIEAIVRLVQPIDIARVAQLTQKTNQFNLTTRRYSEANIEQFAQATEFSVMTIAVRDRFGDMGLTGVLIARRESDRASIDTLLLSCRVLGRNLEFAFVDYSLGFLEEQWKVQRWFAEYLPTAKNRQVINFWDEMGFVDEKTGEERRTYAATPASRRVRKLPYIHIQGQGDDFARAH